MAVSAAAAPANHRFYANAEGTRRATNQRANPVRQTWDLDVFPAQVGPDAWLELLVGLF